MVVADPSTDSSDAEYEPSVLEQALGENTRVRVLTFLARHPDQSFLQADVARAVDASQSRIAHVVPELKESGFVEEGDLDGNWSGVTITDDELGRMLVDLVRTGEHER